MRDPSQQAQHTTHHDRLSVLRLMLPGGWLGKLLALLVGLLALVLVFAFSVVLLVVAAAAALLFWLYVKYRAAILRRPATVQQGQRHPAPDRGQPNGLIIDGEARREDASPIDRDRLR